MNPLPFLAVVAAAGVLAVPPFRRRVISVGKAVAYAGIGTTVTAANGAVDIARAAVTGHDRPRIREAGA